jgi:hypothetical protein
MLGMRDKTRSIRPPAGFVSITEANWRALCERLGVNPLTREIASIGWRGTRMWYVDPDGYRATTGAWPPGYWPGL